MTTTTADFKITLDDSQAKAALDKTRQATVSLNGGLERLDRASSMAAKGMGAMGPALGAASRSSSELLRGVGDLAGLLGGGGLFGVAVAAASVGIVKMYEEFTAFDRVAAGALRSVRAASETELAAVIENIKKMRGELSSFGKTAAQVSRDAAFDARSKAEADILQGQKDELAYREAAKKAVVEFGEQKRRDGEIDADLLRRTRDQLVLNTRAAQERVRAAKAALPALEEQLRIADELLAREKEKIRIEESEKGGKQYQSDKAKADAEAAKAALEAQKTADQIDLDMWNDWVALQEADRKKQIEAIKAEQDEILSIYDARDNARKEREAEHTRFLEAHERERTSAAKAALAERTRAEEEAKRKHEEMVKATTETVVGITVGAVQIGTAAMVSGQRDAFEQIGVYLMAQAGTALIGSGIKLAGEAVVSALTPGAQPLAAAQGAGSAALIGAGIGLGGASQYLAQLSGIGVAAPKGSGGADLGRAPGVGTGSRGFGNASGGGGAGSGSRVTIVNVYGVSGPQAEDRARMTWRDLQLADRRGMGR